MPAITTGLWGQSKTAPDPSIFIIPSINAARNAMRRPFNRSGIKLYI